VGVAALLAVAVSVAQQTPAVLDLKKQLIIDLGGGVGMELALIPAGTFVMGEGDEKHQVTLTKPFYMGKCEVTQEQWQALMDSNPSANKGAKHPVDMVSWEDCQQFLAKLNGKLSGMKASLPTEAQWEYACRAGSTTRFCCGDDETGLADYAWYFDNSGNHTHPVGVKKPNAWGLHDMHGNVSEWCNDRHGRYPSGPQVDPQGPLSIPYRALRGGGFHDLSPCVTSSLRCPFRVPSLRLNSTGFRVALMAGQPAPPSR
jgi:formylglycine-generating enzyme required for sulfatase activity